MYRLGLPEVYLIEYGEAAYPEYCWPVNAWVLLDELCVGKFMIVGVDVAALHLVVAYLGNAVLDFHDGLHLLCSRLGVIADKLEELGHVGLVGSDNGLRLRVLIEIIFRCAQSQSGLRYGYDVVAGVPLVCSHTPCVHHGRFTLAVELCRNALVFLAVLDGFNLLQVCLYWVEAFLVEPHAVHHEVVERANLVAQGAALLGRIGKLEYQLLYLQLVLVVEVREGTVGDMLVVKRMTFQPCSCRVLNEVGTRLYAGVHVGLVKTFKVLCAGGEVPYRKCQHRKHCFLNHSCLYVYCNHIPVMEFVILDDAHVENATSNRTFFFSDYISLSSLSRHRYLRVS